MKKFENYLADFGWQDCHDCDRYCDAGVTVSICNDDMEGFYWYYETDLFIVNIHDFFIKKEMILDGMGDVKEYMIFTSSYIKKGNGEFFYPYETITSNTLFVSYVEQPDFRFLLHGNSPFLSVGINFKKRMIDEYLSDLKETNDFSIQDVFFDTRKMITRPLENIANSILSCKMAQPAAEVFFEAKAKEWFSITLDAYLNKKFKKKLSPLDDKSITCVANYIDDHYATDIPQDILEKIAMMSGTKLKKTFKDKYQMTITEYTQRKRINIAEVLLNTKDMDVKDIAKSVGYSSHSRFSTLFKKYKGIYPSEVKMRDY